MDNLTHGLLGLAVGALRRPDVDPRSPQRSSPTDRAVLLACVVAAELPDLDFFWPAPDPVTHALQAHRGITHALIFSPVVALVASLLAVLVFRGARVRPVFGFALLAVPVAHLLPDLWTGWGTRLLLPFSDQRLTLDWTLVVDPFVTLPLLAGAGWALWRRSQWRKAVLLGLAVCVTYLGSRVAMREVLTAEVASKYPQARVSVFPSPLQVTTWRFAAVGGTSTAVGVVSPREGAREEGRHPAHRQVLPEAVGGLQTVRAALAWARYPLVQWDPSEEGAGGTVRVADLRYHLRGEPTLSFVIDLDREGLVRDARLERGGSASDLARRWREAR